MSRWEDVQTTDPNIPPLATYFVWVEVVNENGPRKQLIKVRAKAGLEHSDELAEIAKTQALGYVCTGWAKHE